jgi:hypothetical protein
MTDPHMTHQHVDCVAHQWLLLAVPAFLPAVVVGGVVLYVALRDRRVRRRTEKYRPANRRRR